MSNALNILLSSFEEMQIASSRNIDTSGISSAEQKIEGVNNAIDSIDGNVGSVNIDTSSVAIAKSNIGTINGAVDSVERNIGKVKIDTSTVPPTNNKIDTVNDAIDSVERNVGKVQFDTATIKAVRAELINTNVTLDGFEDKIRKAKEETEKVKQKQKEVNDTIKAGNNIASSFKSILATIGIGVGIKEAFNLSDELTQTTARLKMIVDEESNINELQDKIFASAQRSRASYTDTADTIAKLSQRAGDLFNNDEAIVFTENLNKMFTVAGASQEEMRSASLQLTQAMGSGVLRGEELNAIYESAPQLIQTIADYIQNNEDVAKSMASSIGVSYESMSTDAMTHIRALAEKGQLSAGLIKTAMLGATDEINNQFNDMPYTWAQVWTTVQNVLLNAFQPVLNVIGSAADWIGSNWATLEPIFWGLAAAVGFLAVAYGVWKVITLAQAIAQGTLNVALLACPITWIVIVIAAIIAAIVIWINKIGGLKVAWLIVMNAILTAFDWLKIGLFTGIYFVMDLWDKLQLKLKSVGTKIADFMGDMKVNVLTILQNMVNGAIDIINGFIEKLNKIPGVSIDTINHVTFASTAAIENEAAKKARAEDLAKFKDEIEANAADRDAKIAQMKDDARIATAERQAEIDKAKVENAAEEKGNGLEDLLEGISENGTNTADNTAKMADSMDSLEDSLEYMLDIAEREVINRFTTAEISVVQTNNNNISSNMDIDGVMERWNADFTEILDTAAEGVHS
jgi:tape measure domain-containing protein